jgi:hypothetical protein
MHVIGSNICCERWREMDAVICLQLAFSEKGFSAKMIKHYLNTSSYVIIERMYSSLVISDTRIKLMYISVEKFRA